MSNEHMLRGVLREYPAPWKLTTDGKFDQVQDATGFTVFEFDHSDESALYELIVVAVNDLSDRLAGDKV